MINIQDKTQCTGCTACSQIYAHYAIIMQYDEYGHSYPNVDVSKCVDCGLCNQVCPLLHKDSFPKDTKLKNLPVHAVYNKDESIRSKSTSGGEFTILAEYVIGLGGVVFAARFDSDFKIYHASFDKIDDIDPYRGSKYAQSELKDTYRLIKKELRSRPVLFVGTPCQVAGLKYYLRKPNDNLYTCDFICMGISSPVIWNDYIRECWSAHKISRILFKDQRDGWHNWKMLIEYDDKKEYRCKGKDDFFFFGYLSHLTYRPSCFECPFRTCRRVSDFTIADCWGIDKVHPDFDDNKGCTTIILQSDKAEKVFDAVRDKLKIEQFDIEDVKTNNPYIVNKISHHPHRESFYKLYWKSGFKTAASCYIKDKISLYERIKKTIKRLLKR